MSGWLLAILLAFAVLAALLLVGRVAKGAREICAAALLLGLAGYAWQGRPDLAGAPQLREKQAEPAFDEALVERRRGMAERFGPASQWFILSDGFARRGQTQQAANVLVSGIKNTPGDANLWLGLGNALVAHDGMLSPGADYAFRRALQLDPEGPAPRYFYGLALAQSGQLVQARAQWAPLAASAPADSKVKAELEENIARIDMLLAGGRR